MVLSRWIDAGLDQEFFDTFDLTFCWICTEYHQWASHFA
jgi:hypothetical protein